MLNVLSEKEKNSIFSPTHTHTSRNLYENGKVFKKLKWFKIFKK